MISVFSPSHNPRFLDECWNSLKAQTYQDFEWIVVLNQGARWECDDGRVKVVIADEIRGVDWIAFLDTPSDRTDWEIRHVGNAPDMSPRRAAKAPKMMPHVYLPEFSHTIWC